MRCWLQKNKFSYKKPAGVPLKADPEKQAAFIQYYNTLMTTTPKDEPMLFGDSVHPTMATKVTYGWIRRGSVVNRLHNSCFQGASQFNGCT